MRMVDVKKVSVDEGLIMTLRDFEIILFALKNTIGRKRYRKNKRAQRDMKQVYIKLARIRLEADMQGKVEDVKKFMETMAATMEAEGKPKQ